MEADKDEKIVQELKDELGSSTNSKKQPREPKPLNKLHKFLRIALTVSIVVDSLSTLDITAATLMPPLQTVDAATPLPVMLVHSGVTILSYCQIGIMLAIAFSLIQWMYRCYLNLEYVNQKGLTTTSSWTIIWWFIPILNWIKPYSIMKEIHLASASDGGSLNMKQLAPGFLKGWWACWVVQGWVVQGLLGRCSELLLNTDPSNIFINFLSIGSNIFEVGAAVFILKVLASITELQNNRIPAIQKS